MTKLSGDDVVISMSAFRERTPADFDQMPEVAAPQPKTNGAVSANGAGANGNSVSPQLAMELPAVWRRAGAPR